MGQISRPCWTNDGQFATEQCPATKNRRVACGIAKGIGTARLRFVLCRQSQGASRDAGACIRR